jgi:hypothetical protein
MFVGQIIYYPYKNGYIRYIIRKIFDDSLLVMTYKSDVSNCIPKDEILTTDEFSKVYHNEKIYE